MEGINLEHIDVIGLDQKSKHCDFCIHRPVCVIIQNMQSMLHGVARPRDDEETTIISEEAIAWLGNLAIFCTEYLEKKT